MITKGQRVKVICSEARIKEVGVRQKHIKHILGKIGTVKEIRKLPNTDDIHKEYDRGYMAKKKMQRTLYDMLQRFRREFGDSGGI